MPSPTTFHLFPRLPPEPQNMIWEFHHARRGIRHYFVHPTKQSSISHFYAAIDTETDLFFDTRIAPLQAKTFWDRDRPIRGETDFKVDFIRKRYVAKAGHMARSVTANKSPWAWSRLSTMPYSVRINFEKDLLVLDGDIDHFWIPQGRFTTKYNWLERVQFLALGPTIIDSLHYYGGCVMFIKLLIQNGLKELRLIFKRPLDCPNGPPRQWSGFEKALLDNHNFLPVEKFVELHPSHRHMICAYPTHLRFTQDRETELMRFLQRDILRSEILIMIVADPY